MSIRKKLVLIITVLIVVTMAILSLISSYIFENHVEKTSKAYLKSNLELARSQLNGRLNEMQKVGLLMSKAPDFIRAVQEEDMHIINDKIEEFEEVYEFIDFYLIFDENKILFKSYPEVNDIGINRLSALIEKAKLNRDYIVSSEVFLLSELFDFESENYHNYKVDISKDEDLSEYFTECLSNITVVPIYDKNDNHLSGYLVMGDILNNDNYYPQAYSEDVVNSSLAISTKGIRITSNISSQKNDPNIGSFIPISSDILDALEGPEDIYYGQAEVDGITHVFLGETIVNIDGEVVGTMGVGIPEEKFSVIMDTNRNFSIIITILILLIMLLIGSYAANQFILPIQKATELAEQIAQGKNDLIIDDKFLKNKKSEVTILLNIFRKMADDLKNTEEERKNYFDKWRKKHAQQQELTLKLELLNDELENKVMARTQDLRQAIMVLKKSDKIKSRFLANMSHELRTPLNGIINSSEVLKEEIFGPLNEKQQKYIQNNLNSSNHLLQLINDILDISKIEAGKMTLYLGDYSISSIVKESFSFVKSLAYRKNIEVLINIIPSDFKILVDAKKLKQILYNLLSNAIKFTPENGKVEVEVLKNQQIVTISVKDNGIGIKKENHGKVFEEFEQVDTSYERKYEGTGLGLSLTKKFVEMHGGDIHLISELGKGTEVIVSLQMNTNKK